MHIFFHVFFFARSLSVLPSPRMHEKTVHWMMMMQLFKHKEANKFGGARPKDERTENPPLSGKADFINHF